MEYVRPAFRLFIASLIVCLTAFILAPSTGLSADTPPALLIVDAHSGEILSARHADERRYPASLTKLMTLYLVFEALRDGTFSSIAEPLTVSEHAASMPASRLGLKSGSSITVEDALLAVIIRSANDAAVVLSEALAGSERDFALKMTHRARQLGMTRTVFRNASGLPHAGARTTALDIATLSQQLIHQFPEHMPLFARKTAKVAGRTLYTTNRLLKQFNGADGLKTGYTDAARFNLAFTASRDGRKLLGVALGYPSAYVRDQRMAEAMRDGFRKTAQARQIGPHGLSGDATYSAASSVDPDLAMVERE